MITQCYLPPDRGDLPAFTPVEAGTRLSDPGGMQGWVDLVGWLHAEMVYPPENGHHPGTNRARRGLTSFMRRTPLTTTPRRQPEVRGHLRRSKAWVDFLEGAQKLLGWGSRGVYLIPYTDRFHKLQFSGPLWGATLAPQNRKSKFGLILLCCVKTQNTTTFWILLEQLNSLI